jgi:hypothetical protein
MQTTRTKVTVTPWMAVAVRPGFSCEDKSNSRECNHFHLRVVFRMAFLDVGFSSISKTNIDESLEIDRHSGI